MAEEDAGANENNNKLDVGKLMRLNQSSHLRQPLQYSSGDLVQIRDNNAPFEHNDR